VERGEPESEKCQSCQAELEPEARFCSACGVAAAGVASDEPPLVVDLRAKDDALPGPAILALSSEQIMEVAGRVRRPAGATRTAQRPLRAAPRSDPRDSDISVHFDEVEVRGTLDKSQDGMPETPTPVGPPDVAARPPTPPSHGRRSGTGGNRLGNRIILSVLIAIMVVMAVGIGAVLAAMTRH
jgi:hypothetical protein